MQLFSIVKKHFNAYVLQCLLKLIRLVAEDRALRVRITTGILVMTYLVLLIFLEV